MIRFLATFPIRRLRAPLCLALASLLALPASVRAAARQGDQRDLSAVAEEQEHLRRQLQRLKRTMESLIPRLEAEGQAHNLALLRAGLVELDLRAEQSRSLTIDELMDSAKSAVTAGQVAQALEQQEQVVRSLERLLAILMDREEVKRLRQEGRL